MITIDLQDLLELSSNHDANLVAQCVRLLHGVSGEDGAAVPDEGCVDHVPDVPLGLRVHAGARLVQQHHLRVPHHRHGVAHLPLGSTAAVLGVFLTKQV